jgi:putative DNA primase/helicase
MSEPTVDLIMADTVKPKSVTWTWAGWIPNLMVSLLAGYPDQGKTTLALKLIADLTRGELDGVHSGKPQTAVVVSLEDVVDRVLVPRLMAAGADLSRVGIVRATEKDGGINLAHHLKPIERRIDEITARFLLIDPVVAAMGSIDGHRDIAVRSILAPLVALAERRELAALVTIHFAKGATDPLLGINGSIGFSGAPRSALVFGTPPGEPENSGKRVLAHSKCNVGVKHEPWEFQLSGALVQTDGEAISTSQITSIGASPLTAEDLVGQRGSEPGDARREAVEFLRGMLANGPMLASELAEQAGGTGISEKTLKRARKELGVFAFQHDRKWFNAADREAAEKFRGSLSESWPPEPRTAREPRAEAKSQGATPWPSDSGGHPRGPLNSDAGQARGNGYHPLDADEAERIMRGAS